MEGGGVLVVVVVGSGMRTWALLYLCRRGRFGDFGCSLWGREGGMAHLLLLLNILLLPTCYSSQLHDHTATDAATLLLPTLRLPRSCVSLRRCLGSRCTMCSHASSDQSGV